MEKTNSYVYSHTRLDTNIIFYIGIGTKIKNINDYGRAYRKAKRSKFWNRIIEKTDYRIDILFDNLTWNEACKKEIELIAFYGRRNLGLGQLVNLTNGGDGAKGVIITPEQRIKIGLGNKGKIRTEEQKEINRKAHLGKKVSEETKEKMRIISSTKRHSDSTKEMIRNQRLGIKRSPETIEKMRISLTGIKHSDLANKKKMKPVFNTETGIFYDSVGEAAETIGLSISKLSNRLSGWAKNKTSFVYV